MLHQSCISAKDLGDNEVKLGAVHRSPGIYLTATENPGKPQLGDRLVKVVRPVITSNGVLYLKITQHQKEKEGNKERTFSYSSSICYLFFSTKLIKYLCREFNLHPFYGFAIRSLRNFQGLIHIGTAIL